ncbi:MAG: hypothetical protein JNK02_03995 [Planctomycetes bacterium]|nr:hypothetical protein [Planctomycetota bacterium]
MRPGPGSAAHVREAFAGLAPAIANLWTGLLTGGRPSRPLRLAFSACAHGDGATTVAVCAALGLARQLREEVVLVEANGATPGLSRILGLEPGPGLDEVQRGVVPLAGALRATDEPGVWLLPFGGDAVGPPVGVAREAALGLDAARTIGETCAAQGRHLLLDVAPVLVHPSTVPLLWTVDSTVAVWSAGHTLRKDAAAMVQALEAAGSPLAGTILNRHREELPRWIRGWWRRG